MSSLRVRKRANTRVLLGDDYVEVVEEILPPPKPLLNASDYTADRLKEALKYADCTLRNNNRKLSPIGIHALTLYKDACGRLLDLEEGEIFEDDKELEDAKGEWIASIGTYEQSIQYVGCLNVTHTQDAQTLQDEIIGLQRTSFYARYGNYMAHACQELKREAEAKKVTGWQNLQKSYWTDIDKRLINEQDIYERCRQRGENLNGQCPTTVAVSQACNIVGLNLTDMLQNIHYYAVRNEIVHANLLALVKDGEFPTLAKRLYDDYCDVPRFIACFENRTSDMMLTLIESIINLWFDRDLDEPEQYQFWTAKKALKDLYKELKGSRDDAKINKQVTKEIVQAVKKARRDMETEDMLHKMLHLDLGVVGGNKAKRVASSELEVEKSKAKRMKAEWDKIVGYPAGLRKMSDSYALTYGELAAPPEVVHDPSLGE
jgi:hypothetical protein